MSGYDPRKPGPSSTSRARPGGAARPVPRVPQPGTRRSRSNPPGPAPARTPTRALPAGERRRYESTYAPPAHHSTDHAFNSSPSGVDNSMPSDRRQHGPGRRFRLPRWARLARTLIILWLVVTVGWFAGLFLWANGRMHHVEALSGAPDTGGTTWLIAGSDSRANEDAVPQDGTRGQRADTMMLLHKAPNGKSYLVSLPRDTLVNIPGKGMYKLNAAFAFGGPKLLVQTVENLTGLTVDHYVQVGFDGVRNIVDAVGTVNLCLDRNVNDPKSGLNWVSGCHDVGGEQALAFVRARYFDPTADLGRQKRQQQFVGSLMKRVVSPGTVLNPFSQLALVRAGTDSLTTDPGTGLLGLGQAGLAFRNASSNNRVLTMPIENPAYRTKNSGVAIKVNDAEVKKFFAAIGDGTAAAKEKP
ncbi:LCP family protein [Devriesea agamarum]|uniref:LCP family protein n=1 Tax=Devriesea agamarum TaxID=472569 RepID=UPI000A98DF65|nr:LCP family protein [Devriesea agamarum]